MVRAVRLLAHWSDNIKIRLAKAYMCHLCYIHAEVMPTKALREKLLKVQKRLTKNHTQPVNEAIHRWPLKSCCAIADDICDLYYGFTHFEWHLHPEKSLLELLVE